MARAGGVALAVGVALFLLALGTTSIYVYVLAAVIAGAGFGCGFLGALRSVSQLAEPQERAALLSAVFVVSYVAFSVPALAAGVLATHIGLLNTSLAYGGVVALIALGTLSLEWLTDR
jgi:MFS family permease